MLEKVINRVSRYQELKLVQKLKCECDDIHSGVHVIYINEEMRIACNDCEWEGRVPLMFFNDEMDEFIEQQEITQSRLLDENYHI